MAVHAPIIAGAACAPGIVPEFAAPTRRGMLALLGAAPIAAIPFAPAASSTGTRWTMLVAKHRAAVDAAKKFDDEVCVPTGERYFHQTAPRPQIVWNGNEPAKTPEWVAYTERCERASIETGYDAVEAEYDRLVGIECEAENALIAEPAPDGEALALKIILAVSDQPMMQSHHHAAILRDAKRLASAE